MKAGLVILSFCLSLSSFAAINIDGFSTQANDRFASDPGFIASAFDLSGVTIADDGRWVTMISENVFLSAHHFFPANGTSVTFYGSNDPAGSTATRTIQSSQRIGSSDLRIGTLNAGLGSGFTFYNFAVDDTLNFNSTGNPGDRFTSSPYYLADAYMFGRSPTSFSVSQDIAVGRNKLDVWFDGVTTAGTTDDAMGARIDAQGESNFLPYEASLQAGDSGAPMLVEDGSGALTIVGINWFIGTVGEDNYNGFSYVGNYDAEIQTYLDVNPVPEVRFFGLILGLGILAWMPIKRRPLVRS
jgi:hypothetical protein